MRAVMCPLWPGGGRGGGCCHPGGIAVIAAMGMLTACLVILVGAYLWAERGGVLDLESLAGPESAMQDVGPLAPVLVEVNARGWAFVAGRRVTPPALRGLLRRAVRLLPEQQVIFKVSESTPTQYLGPFLEACTAAGIQRVNFMEAKADQGDP